jgi:hypothetical protein
MMLEQDTERIYRTLSDRTIGARTEYRMRDLLAAGLPRGITSFFQGEIMERLATELRAGHHLRRVDIGGPGAGRFFYGLLRTLSIGYTMPREEYLSMLGSAVYFLGNYLVRPSLTLEHHVFRGTPRVALSVMEPRLASVAEYRYLPRLLLKVSIARRWTEIGVEDFRTLATQIEHRVVHEHEPREIARLVKPIFDFLLLCDAPPDEPIPLTPVLAFLDHKGERIMKGYVEGICHIRNRTEITLHELAELLHDLSNARQAAPSEPDMPHAVHPVVANPSLALSAAGLQSNAGSPPLPSVASLMSAEDCVRFTTRICSGDPTLFASVMQELHVCATWADASRSLQSLYQRRGIDPRAPEAFLLTDTIHRRYQ